MELPDDENVLENGALEPVPESEKGLRRYGVVAPRMVEGPIDLNAVIPGDTPLEIDIGFGRGQSLFRRAAVAPSWRLMGIEIKTKWAYKVEERRLREGLVNVRAFAGDAREVLERATPSACVERFYVHFPDPWWKRRHTHRTVVADRFLESAARLLRDGGELFVQTDVKARAEEYAERMGAHPLFGGVQRLDDNPYGSVSGREAKAELDGLPIYRLVAARLPRDASDVDEEE